MYICYHLGAAALRTWFYPFCQRDNVQTDTVNGKEQPVELVAGLKGSLI